MAKSGDNISVLGMDYTIHKVRREQDPDLAENWEHQGFGQEETVVDWLAIQGPKIYRAWTEAGAV